MQFCPPNITDFVSEKKNVKTLISACALACTMLAATSMAQPKINAVENNYSYIVPGLPNYGIAQGSIFVIFGANLADSSTGLQKTPQATLNNVSVTVTVNGATFQPLLYYVTATQIAAILPSATPVGTGQITVINDGQASSPAPITVVQSAFGMLTLNGAGSGPAAAFDTNYQYLTFTNAANPGDYIMLWGTGVGPVADDAVGTQTTASIEVDIGGVSADVKYHGRSSFAGLDQINVVVPPGVSGCYVSVVVRSGAYVSNFASIPVAASGRTCSDQNTGFTASQLQTLTSKGSFTVGAILLGKTTVVTPPVVVNGIVLSSGGTTSTDIGYAGFTRFTPEVFNAFSVLTGTSQTTSMGSCSVFATSGTSASALIPTGSTATLLDAGQTIHITGPNGTALLPFQNGFYSATIGGGSGGLATFIPSEGGTFNIDNGEGGKDIGKFFTQITLAPTLVWSELNSISTINRSQGVTVHWTGGADGTYVVITGTSLALNGTSGLIGIFSCTAPVSAKQFTVPASVLLALPASAGETIDGVTINVGSSLSVSNYSNPQPFSADKLDFGTVSAYVGSSTANVTYQ